MSVGGAGGGGSLAAYLLWLLSGLGGGLVWFGRPGPACPPVQVQCPEPAEVQVTVHCLANETSSVTSAAAPQGAGLAQGAALLLAESRGWLVAFAGVLGGAALEGLLLAWCCCDRGARGVRRAVVRDGAVAGAPLARQLRG